MNSVIHIVSQYDWHCGAWHEYEKDPRRNYISTSNQKDVTCPDCLEKRLTAEYGIYHPSFPRTKFADKNAIGLQVEHVSAEAQEANEAISWSCKSMFDDTALELMDTIHSAETALFILAEKHGVNLSEVKRKVIEKNQARGYYK